jgi:hypothetical protein
MRRTHALPGAAPQPDVVAPYASPTRRLMMPRARIVPPVAVTLDDIGSNASYNA